jgi:hypothetical protein
VPTRSYISWRQIWDVRDVRQVGNRRTSSLSNMPRIFPLFIRELLCMTPTLAFARERTNEIADPNLNLKTHFTPWFDSYKYLPLRNAPILELGTSPIGLSGIRIAHKRGFCQLAVATRPNNFLMCKVSNTAYTK